MATTPANTFSVPLRRPHHALGIGVLAAIACTSACEHTAPRRPTIAVQPTLAVAATGSTAIRDNVLAEMLIELPNLGRQLGLHEYDGKLSDYSSTGFVHRRDALSKWHSTLAGGPSTSLSPNEALDLALLRFAVESETFKLVDLDAAHKRPDAYTDIFDVAQYIDDEEAPLSLRMARVALHEEAALAQAPHVLENLRPPLSRAIAHWQAGVWHGIASYLRDDVPNRFVGVGDAALREHFARANTALAAHAEHIASAIDGWAATGDESHVLGPALYRTFLLAEEGMSTPLADFKQMGEENLAANQKAYEELARTTPLTRPSSSEELGIATRLVEEARSFVIAHHVVSIPKGERPVPVRESPAYFRGGAQLAGAGKSAVYYITLPDPSLPVAEQREYVMPFGVLRTNTVHEVYPGHYVQSLWADLAPTRVQQMSFNLTFAEGWAHYTEQMMLEEGFGASDPENRLGQLREALRRNCRYLASIGLHTEGMTLREAEDLFMSRCHQDRATARQNAERGQYDPGYFSYTLGKVEILALRDEVKRALGDRFSLQRFHDALLAHGRPPIPVLRPVLLRELGVTP
jgi:hypothetical protein